MTYRTIPNDRSHSPSAENHQASPITTARSTPLQVQKFQEKEIRVSFHKRCCFLNLNSPFSSGTCNLAYSSSHLFYNVGYNTRLTKL